MSFVIQSGTEGQTSVERIWEQFPMPVPGADSWSSEFAYYTEDLQGNLPEGGPAGSDVARRFDVLADLDARPRRAGADGHSRGVGRAISRERIA